MVRQVDYTRSDRLKGTMEFTHVLPIVVPFEITTQFYTMQFEPLTKGFINEPFVMMPHIVCTSPWPIDIIETSIELVSIYVMALGSVVRNARFV